jgi:hypothetical protein
VLLFHNSPETNGVFYILALTNEANPKKLYQHLWRFLRIAISKTNYVVVSSFYAPPPIRRTRPIFRPLLSGSNIIEEFSLQVQMQDRSLGHDLHILQQRWPMDVTNLGSVDHFDCNDFSDGHVCAVHHSVGQSSREQPELSGVTVLHQTSSSPVQLSEVA